MTEILGKFVVYSRERERGKRYLLFCQIFTWKVFLKETVNKFLLTLGLFL
jgi:hypothetical protein